MRQGEKVLSGRDELKAKRRQRTACPAAGGSVDPAARPSVEEGVFARWTLGALTTSKRPVETDCERRAPPCGEPTLFPLGFEDSS